MIENKAWKSGILSKLKYKSICKVCAAFICLQILPFSEFCSKDLWALEAESIKVGDRVNKVAEKLLVRSSQEKDRNGGNLWKSGNVLVALEGEKSDGGLVLVSAGDGHHFEDIKRVEEEFSKYKEVTLKVLDIADVLDIVKHFDNSDDRIKRKSFLAQIDSSDLERTSYQPDVVIYVIESLIDYIEYLRPSLRESGLMRPVLLGDKVKTCKGGNITDKDSFNIALSLLRYFLKENRALKADLTLVKQAEIQQKQIDTNRMKIVEQYERQKQLGASAKQRRDAQKEINDNFDAIMEIRNKMDADRNQVNAARDRMDQIIEVTNVFLQAIFHEKPKLASEYLKKQLPNVTNGDIHSGIEYLRHAFHTEAQVQVLVNCNYLNKKKDSIPSVLLSRKLPCWSCARLPILDSIKFVAYDLGIGRAELPVYPVPIIYRKHIYEANERNGVYLIEQRKNPIPLLLLYDGMRDHTEYLQLRRKTPLKTTENFGIIPRTW